MSKVRRSIYTLYLSTFLMNMQFALPISVLFGTQYLDFNFTQTMALAAAIELAIAVLEVPTGAWVDRYGYLLLYRIGLLLFAIPILGFVFLKNFYVLLMLQCVGGLGLAMVSGTLQAFVYSSLPSKNRDFINTSVASKNLAARHLGRAIAVLAGSFLYEVNPVLPYGMYATSIVACLGFAFTLPRMRFDRTKAVSNWQQTSETFQMLLTTRQMRLFLSQVVLFQLFTQALWYFYQPYFVSIGIEESYFGIYYFGAAVMAVLGSLQVSKTMRRFGTQYIFVGVAFAATFTTILFLFQNPLVAFVAVLPAAGMTGIRSAVTSIVIQKHTEATHQTTALSIISLSDGLAMGLANVAIGIAMDVTSTLTITLTLAVAGVLLSAGSFAAAQRENLRGTL